MNKDSRFLPISILAHPTQLGIKLSYRQPEALLNISGLPVTGKVVGHPQKALATTENPVRRYSNCKLRKYLLHTRVTVSMGFANHSKLNATVEEVIEAADKALYRAKEEG